MPSDKEKKYLARITGNNAPPVAVESSDQTEEVTDNRLSLLIGAFNALQLGIVASVDEEEGDVYLGKQTDNGNHYIIIYPENKGFAYAYANQAKGEGNVIECEIIQDAVNLFKEKTLKTK